MQKLNFKFLLVSWIFSMISMLLQGQLSPGPLSAAHAHLEGLSNCTKCHEPGQKVTNRKCLECHKEINARIIAAKGYHASAAVKNKECYTCHSDHHGRNFQLIRFNPEQFNHEITGFLLKGAHRNVSCRECHRKEKNTDPLLQKRPNTYLGLDNRCISCHTDPHLETLGTKCEGCHNPERFKPATGFSHENASFQLKGKHITVPCQSCHPVVTRNGKPFQNFRGLDFSGCTPCHTDPHQGRFGKNCSQCHTEAGFSQIRNTEQFDHSKTDFPLEGRHSAVSCRTCHRSKLTDPLAHSRCDDCHADYHEGELQGKEGKPDCATCHTTSGFSETLYTTEQHHLSAFPLKGAHLATPCFACHRKNLRWTFRNIGLACADCHIDVHAPSITPRYYPDAECRACHQETSWDEIRFDHSVTGYLLTGAHAKPSCRSCHFRRDEQGKVVQQFAGLTTRCSGCHNDPHYQQFDPELPGDCGRCHTTSHFRPAALFDHSKTLFPLDGRHGELSCERCHPLVKAKGRVYTLYKTGKIKCEDCHQ